MLEKIFVPGAVVPNAGRFMGGAPADFDPDVRQFVSVNTESIMFQLGAQPGQVRGTSFYSAKYVPWVEGKINTCEAGQSDGISSRFSGCRFVKFTWRTVSGAMKTYYGHVHQGGAICCKKTWADLKGWDRSFTVHADFRPYDAPKNDGDLMQQAVEMQQTLGGRFNVLGIITKDNRCYSVAGIHFPVQRGSKDYSFHVQRVYQIHTSSLVEVLV